MRHHHEQYGRNECPDRNDMDRARQVRHPLTLSGKNANLNAGVGITPPREHH
jgi:hypothetical protein